MLWLQQCFAWDFIPGLVHGGGGVCFLHTRSIESYATFPPVCMFVRPGHYDLQSLLWHIMLSGDAVMQGLVGITSNPVLADGISGLATSATAFAAVERTLLYQMRNATVEPFGESVQQVFSRISALRDSLDGPQVSYCTFCCVICAGCGFNPRLCHVVDFCIQNCSPFATSSCLHSLMLCLTS